MLGKPFFRVNTVTRENGTAQREKARRPGALAVFGYTIDQLVMDWMAFSASCLMVLAASFVN